MKVFYLYIIKKFLVTFVVIIGLFIFISVIFDLSEKIDDLLKNQATLHEIIFDYYANFVPYYINLLSPLFIFIAAIYFTSRMAYNSEFVAILTSGANYYKLFIPYFITGALLAGMSFYLNGYVIPHGTKKKVEFEYKYIFSSRSDLKDVIHRQIEPNVYIYMQNWDANDSVGYQFSLEKFHHNDLTYKLLAQKVSWEKDSNKWMAWHYTIRRNDGFHEYYTKGNELYIKMPIEPADFGRKTSNIEYLNNGEMTRYIKEEKARGESLVNFYLTLKYSRTSQPFATFILIIIAFALASRKIRGGTGLHLGLGLLITFSYIFFQRFSTMFSIKGDLNPLLSVWIPNIVYSVLGYYLLIKAPK